MKTIQLFDSMGFSLAYVRRFWLAVFAVASLALGGCQKAQQFPTPLPGQANGYTGRAPASAMPGAPAFLPVSQEELWIITRPERKMARSKEKDDLPGSGTLMCRVEEHEVPLPLNHTDVKVSISGYIATVDVTQQFQNPYNGKIEAVYVFPLPENAAIHEFVMVIGERRIRGIIRERQEAERIYQEARRQGYVASLLTEERPNIFTQHVANIEPGKQIDVLIRYYHTLAWRDGWYEFVFPMVVGPRFNPVGSTQGVGAAGRGNQGASGQATEVQYLRPGERSGHDISLQVNLQAGVKVEEVVCRSHPVTRSAEQGEHLQIALSAKDKIPNKDFVLRYRVAGDQVKSGLLTHEDQRGGFFTLMLYPPMETTDLGRQAMEMVFVLDCSGSMSGKPIEQAKNAIERGLRLLRRGDSFQIINFSTRASRLGARPLEATPENIRKGLKYLASLNGEGGTMMIEGIKAALNFPHDPRRLRFVSFLTDGYIGNESEILAAIHERLGASRIFSFGVGSSPNRYLMDQMGKMGRGAVAYLSLQDDGAEIMEDFFNSISRPALADIQVDWGQWSVTETYPRQIPDLFTGRPVILTGRFQGAKPDGIRVRGKVPGRVIHFDVPLQPTEFGSRQPGLPSVWARMKIADLAERAIYDRFETSPNEIKQLALDYNLMSAFTAFVAVDSTRRTEGREGTTVPVSVPVPDGVKYQTTVAE